MQLSSKCTVKAKFLQLSRRYTALAIITVRQIPLHTSFSLIVSTNLIFPLFLSTCHNRSLAFHQCSVQVQCIFRSTIANKTLKQCPLLPRPLTHSRRPRFADSPSITIRNLERHVGVGWRCYRNSCCKFTSLCTCILLHRLISTPHPRAPRPHPQPYIPDLASRSPLLRCQLLLYLGHLDGQPTPRGVI